MPSNNIRIKGMHTYSYVLIEKLLLKKDGLTNSKPYLYM